jgi:hypothetical protein
MKLFKTIRQRFLFSSTLWMLYGIFSVLRYRQTGDEFLLWSGIIIGGLHAIVFVLFLFKKEKVEE